MSEEEKRTLYTRILNKKLAVLSHFEKALKENNDSIVKLEPQIINDDLKTVTVVYSDERNRQFRKSACVVADSPAAMMLDILKQAVL
jgi:hypothetical protein